MFSGISVFAQPDVIVIASETEACSPAIIGFSCNVPGYTVLSNYHWEVLGTSLESIEEEPEWSFTEGSYIIKLTVDCDGIEGVGQIEIQVYEPPTASFDTTRFVICEGDSNPHTFIDESILGSADIETWSWYFGDGNGSSEQNPPATYSSGGIYSVSLVITDENSCVSNFTGNDMVLVIDLPTVDITSENHTSCNYPHTVDFTANVTTDFTYFLTWNFGDGSEPVDITDSDLASHLYSSIGSYDVVVSVTDENNCENSSSYIDYVQVGEVIANYSTLEGDTVCKDVIVNFQNETSYSCFWDFGDGNTSYLNTPTHSYSESNESVTGLFIVDPNGPCEDSALIELFVEDVTASYTTDPLDLNSCTAPFSVDFASNSSGNAVGFFYVFQDGLSATIQDVTHEYLNTGIYQPALTVTTVNGCYNTYIGPVISVNAPDASFDADVLQGCENLYVEFAYSGSTEVGNITNFHWYFGSLDENPDGGVNADYTFPAGSHTVTLEITDIFECVATHSVEILVGTEYENPIFSVVSFPDHLPLSSHVFCAQEDSVSLYFQQWNDPAIEEFYWLIDSTDNENSTEEYLDWAYEQDTGSIYFDIVIIKEDGCTDTIYWDSLYFSGPIINAISIDAECNNSTDFVFNLDQTLADSWDWYIYYFDPPTDYTNPIYEDQELGATDESYPYSFLDQDNEYWVRVVAHCDTTDCEYVDSVQVVFSAPVADFTLQSDEVCVGVPVPLYSGNSDNCIEYNWNFGDGTNSGYSVDETVQYPYSEIGDYEITLTGIDVNDCVDSISHTIHVIGAEVYMSPDVTYGCNSLDVVFTDESVPSPGESIAQVSWDFGDGSILQNTAGGGEIPHTYDEPGVYTVTVVVYAGGCPTTKVFTDTIVVEELSSGFSAEQVGCVGEEMSFTAIENDLNYIYTWSFGDGSIDVSGNNPSPSHPYSEGGEYNISLQVDNDNGCIVSDSIVDYIIIEEPHAEFALDGDIDYFGCYPVDIEIINLVSVVPSNISIDDLEYSWDMGVGEPIEVQYPDYLYVDPGEFLIELTVTSPNNCVDTYSKGIEIDGPSADLDISSYSICIGDEVEVVISNMLGVDEFKWFAGDGVSYTQESFTHAYTFVPSSGYFESVLQLTATIDGQVCNVTIPFENDIYVFDVTAGVKVTDTASSVIFPNEDVEGFCAPLNVILTSESESVPAGGVLSYVWEINGSLYGGNNETEPYLFENDGIGDETVTIYLRVDDVNGCHRDTSLDIIVYANPVVDISEDALICYGDALTIYATGGEDVDGGYIWSPNEAITAVNIGAPTVNPTENITYFVDVWNGHGCSTSSSVDISVQLEPDVLLTPEVDTIIIGDTVYSTLVADQENLTFSWTPQTAISCFDCPEPFFNPEESIRYNLTVEDSMQCFRYNYYVDIVVIEKYTLDVPMAFTPQGKPENSKVFVRGYGIKNLLQFRIYNRWGQELFYTDDINEGWNGYFAGQLQNVDNYSYYVEAEMYDGSIVTKKGNIMLIR